jgi:hypothetical protein
MSATCQTALSRLTDLGDRNLVEFLVKLRDSLSMASDATNQYIETLAPKEVKQEQVVNESIFLVLKFDDQKGDKLGEFAVAYKASNQEGPWNEAYTVLNKASATIKDRYKGKGYQFSYWIYGEGKIYRQKLKGKL